MDTLQALSPMFEAVHSLLVSILLGLLAVNKSFMKLVTACVNYDNCDVQSAEGAIIYFPLCSCLYYEH
jgi:hypothetical protein